MRIIANRLRTAFTRLHGLLLFCLLAAGGGGLWWMTRSQEAVSERRPPDKEGDTKDRGHPPADPSKQSGDGPGFYREVHALVVGIDAYDSADFEPLRFAKKDAEALADLLEQSFGYRTTTLLGARATRAAVQKQLERYSEELQPDDALVVFFAGHGVQVEAGPLERRVFLPTRDTVLKAGERQDLAVWESRALDLSALGKRLSALKCRHVLLLLDTCHAGFVGQPATLGRFKDVATNAKAPSCLALTAGAAKQQAQEKEERQHGVFTGTLLQQLREKTPLSVTELFLSVRPAIARGTNHQQTPQLRELRANAQGGEFLFLPRSLSASELPSTLTRLARNLQERAVAWTTEEDVLEVFEAREARFGSKAQEEWERWNRRYQRFQENAALGDPMAMAALFYCYTKGLGTDRNLERALMWAREAHASKSPAGLHVLAESCRMRLGGIENPAAGEDLLRKAADADFAPSVLIRVEEGLKDKPDAARVKEAWTRLDRLSAKGSTRALVLQAKAWLGQPRLAGVEPDLAKAVPLLEKAAKAGDPEADYLLARQDGPDAFDRCSRAAAWGLPEAQAWLARLYCRAPRPMTKDPKPDFERARTFAEQAAKQGNPEAHFLLAQLHKLGLGGAVNLEHVKSHLEAACEKNVAAALWLKAIYSHTREAGYRAEGPERLDRFARAVETDSSWRFLDSPFWLDPKPQAFLDPNALQTLRKTPANEVRAALTSIVVQDATRRVIDMLKKP